MSKKPRHSIKCDLCKGEFPLTKEALREEQITLYKDGLDPHEVRLTFLTCPLCGKHYPVIMDDESTLPLLEKLRSLMVKQTKQIKKGFTPKPKAEDKRKDLNKKLDFKRQKLALKYKGSRYQLENGLWEQLDYRYHAR